MAHEDWGYVLMAIGALFVYWGTRRSDFPLYRLFLARYRVSGRDDGHRMFQLSGIAMIALGGLLAAGLL
jgi:hypothetical protein